MLSIKQGGNKYHFLSFWYDSTRDWTLVSRVIGEHSTYKAMGRIVRNYSPIYSNVSLFGLLESKFTIEHVHLQSKTLHQK